MIVLFQPHIVLIHTIYVLAAVAVQVQPCTYTLFGKSNQSTTLSMFRWLRYPFNGNTLLIRMTNAKHEVNMLTCHSLF